MGKPLPAPVRDVETDVDAEQKRHEAYDAARRARLLADDLPSGVYPTESFSEKRKAR